MRQQEETQSDSYSRSMSLKKITILSETTVIASVVTFVIANATKVYDKPVQ